eukprot:8532224-Alexandrium_andersonii.AAC.1
MAPSYPGRLAPATVPSAPQGGIAWQQDALLATQLRLLRCQPPSPGRCPRRARWWLGLDPDWRRWRL